MTILATLNMTPPTRETSMEQMVISYENGSSSRRTLQKRIGYHFQNEDILVEALTHDSCRVDDPNIKTYQRLEHLDEGTLTMRRISLVRGKKQEEISDQLELHKFVKMNQSVREFSRYDRFLEAVIGAVFIDAGGESKGGYDEVKEVIYNLWELSEDEIASQGLRKRGGRPTMPPRLFDVPSVCPSVVKRSTTLYRVNEPRRAKGQPTLVHVELAINPKREPTRTPDEGFIFPCKTHIWPNGVALNLKICIFDQLQTPITFAVYVGFLKFYA
ncbi:Ribonuclease 3 [Folsomia candida]|uniref:Ribonuclease 3 n=1 Tax=Folsomia candida TaxID=158441 RepID=A0A226EVS4_FOLCA|nr:Ribonuclease 3 [Folsomia candida]